MGDFPGYLPLCTEYIKPSHKVLFGSKSRGTSHKMLIFAMEFKTVVTLNVIRDFFGFCKFSDRLLIFLIFISSAENIKYWHWFCWYNAHTMESVEYICTSYIMRYIKSYGLYKLIFNCWKSINAMNQYNTDLEFYE